ncbi:acetamidase/formamidase family protein [Aquella oligotrophica]|uniref:Amidase n=1 Tax=Aquella oligotrophica TaxID=2067065 RepID=A0A2I7N2Z2_9NEIS|nr:acetamidase/formamidase family protein [Aquella oligotrophica]AUR50823.1 amidase [Aquella oligotrophica]
MKKIQIKTVLGVLLILNMPLSSYAVEQASSAIAAKPQNFENCLDFLPGRLDQNLMLAPAKTSKQTAKTYILPATPATTQWGYFDNKQPPVLKIKPGDSVVIETDAASNNQVVPGVSVDQVKKMNDAVPGRGPHTVTGPIYVDGAEPGDVLQIHINKIVPRPYGSNNSLPGKGLLPEKFPKGQIKYFYLDTKNMVAQFAPGIEIPLKPFPGVLAVASSTNGKLDTAPPGKFGGNLDLNQLQEGTTLYLPVFIKGGLVWTGDSHAVQGNGEVNLTALETAFEELNLTINVIKNKKLDWPIAETPDSWITVGYDTNLDKAINLLKANTIQFIAGQRKVSKAEAEKIMYANWNCPVAEVVDGVLGMYCIVPKKADAPKPAPLLSQDNNDFYVTTAQNKDALQAMKDATWAMITKIEKDKKMTQLDIYSLLSMTMDCRLSTYVSGAKDFHCVVPKSLWVDSKSSAQTSN